MAGTPSCMAWVIRQIHRRNYVQHLHYINVQRLTEIAAGTELRSDVVMTSMQRYYVIMDLLDFKLYLFDYFRCQL